MDIEKIKEAIEPIAKRLDVSIYKVVYEKENGKISDTTKSGLKGTVITTDFENKQTSFVMDGVGTISKSGNGFAGNIPLTRTSRSHGRGR